MMTKEPLHDCPLCDGKGKIKWYLNTDVGGRQWKGIRKEPVRVVETPRSKSRRASWLTIQDENRVGPCPCTLWNRDRNFRRRLWNLTGYMVRVKQNTPIQESDLNDDLDGI